MYKCWAYKKSVYSKKKKQKKKNYYQVSGESHAFPLKYSIILKKSWNIYCI